MNQTLATINAIWIGNQLGPVHVACLSSFLNHGHKVVLYSYGIIEDKPEGVLLADANQLIPETYLVRHRKTGDLSLFSDFLRYVLIQKGLGLYVDCDVYCLKPIVDTDFIVGWYRDDLVNNAILKLPPDCPALSDLCSIPINRQYIPPWFSTSKRLKFQLRRLIGRGGVEDLPWGTVGPTALTYFLQKHNLFSHAQPSDIFYPLPSDQFNLLFDPELSVADLVSQRTITIHLSNTVLKRRLEGYIPTNCPLDELVQF